MLENTARWLVVLLSALLPLEPAAKAPDEAFSVVFIGDLQNAGQPDNRCKRSVGLPWVPQALDWIRAHREEHDIRGVFQVGDVTRNNRSCQWEYIAPILKGPDAWTPRLPLYTIMGNHDVARSDVSARTWHDTLGCGYHDARPWAEEIVSRSPGCESYAVKLEIGSGQMIFLMMKWIGAGTNECAGANVECAWAEGVLAAHPDTPAIVVSHAGWDGANPLVRRHANVMSAVFGHFMGRRWSNAIGSRADGSEWVDQFVNCQDCQNGDGLIRMMTWDPATGSMRLSTVQTYNGQFVKNGTQHEWNGTYDFAERAWTLTDPEPWRRHAHGGGWLDDPNCVDARLVDTLTGAPRCGSTPGVLDTMTRPDSSNTFGGVYTALPPMPGRTDASVFTRQGNFTRPSRTRWDTLAADAAYVSDQGTRCLNVYPGFEDPDGAWMMHHDDARSSGRGFHLGFDDDSGRFMCEIDGQSRTARVVKNRWQHVCCRWKTDASGAGHVTVNVDGAAQQKTRKTPGDAIRYPDAAADDGIVLHLQTDNSKLNAGYNSIVMFDRYLRDDEINHLYRCGVRDELIESERPASGPLRGPKGETSCR